MALQTSPNGLTLIKNFESYSPKAYVCPAGKNTIGYGHVIKQGEMFTEVSMVQAENLLKSDLRWVESAINKCLNIEVRQSEFDALASLTFNIGGTNLLKSTLLVKLNNGDIDGAADQFLVWNKATVNGKLVTLPGLQRRRAVERGVFLS